MTKGPVLIDLAADSVARPDIAPIVSDGATIEQTSTAKLAQLAAQRPSRIAQMFWAIAIALVSFITTLAAWDYATSLLERAPVLGVIASALIGLLLVVFLVIGLREMAAFGRLRRLDHLQKQARMAQAAGDLTAAKAVVHDLTALYARREDTAWGRANLAQRRAEMVDADALLGLAETSLMAQLDTKASAEVIAATRQVATVTAFVPLALADLITTLTANLRMIRRIAEIYGGRAGTLGSWRLTRAVLAHLVATGALAVGDDLISSVAGGGILAKVSRRFGEGVVNGALTARVGIAAIEVCRPLPFVVCARPSVSVLVRRALTGLFTKA
jgi:putative membrane protein